MLADACGRKLNTYLPDYVVFDLETTGTSCYSDAVVEISAVKVKGGSVVDEFTTLVNPERHIPGFVVGIHGISDDMVKDSPCFREALSDFLDFAGDEVFVGHNIQSFDLKFLYRDAQNYWGKTIGNDYIDTLSFARKVLKGLDHYRLSDL
ncbi:MAG TPA: DNA polymerase III subunit epsilon, partial [Clostridiales bacterium]|nr:DNA polymerase III subunit epsilon [Clostridiales bacterium]